MTCGIYQITAPSGHAYVGSSRNIESRRSDHFRTLRGKRHINHILQAAFNKYGALNFSVILICRERDLIMYEQQCIDVLKPKYNRSRTAGSHGPHSDETRAKISRSLTGKRISPETRARLSEIRKGVSQTKEHAAKRALAHIGNTHALGFKKTPEMIAKSAAFHTGRKRSLATRQKIREKALARHRNALCE